MKNGLSVADAMRRLEEMAAEISGKKADPSAEARKQAAAYNAAFWDTMHTGMAQNSLKEGSDGAGGYLVPDTFEDKLVERLTEKNVLRRIGRTLQTTQKLKIPVVLKDGDAVWTGEGEDYTLDTAEYDQVEIDAYKLATSILASDEMLEDGGIDLEAHILKAFGDIVGDAEEEAFLHGDGNGKPVGLLNQVSVGAVTENVGTVTLDDMINMEHSVPAPYRQNATWLMSEDVYRTLRQIRHYRGYPLWEYGLAEGEPEKLFGYPVMTSEFMDAVAPGSKSVLFGDFSYYWIGDRGKRVIKRLVEHYANRGQVAFLTYERVDAKLVLPNTIKALETRAA